MTIYHIITLTESILMLIAIMFAMYFAIKEYKQEQAEKQKKDEQQFCDHMIINTKKEEYAVTISKLQALESLMILTSNLEQNEELEQAVFIITEYIKNRE